MLIGELKKNYENGKAHKHCTNENCLKKGYYCEFQKNVAKKIFVYMYKKSKEIQIMSRVENDATLKRKLKALDESIAKYHKLIEHRLSMSKKIDEKAEELRKQMFNIICHVLNEFSEEEYEDQIDCLVKELATKTSARNELLAEPESDIRRRYHGMNQ